MIEGTYHYYLAAFTLFLIGTYMMIDNPNLIKKVIGLNFAQISVYLMLVTIGYVEDANPPIIGLGEPYSNPMVHVLVLTAIVVGVSLTALALALVIRLYSEFGTLDTREIEAMIAASEGDDTNTGGGGDD
ncbi:pH adaptation potassium efflux system protein C, sodium/hydrogen antiporter subunit [Natronococcus amylolyticus DSM 10524]|uniref:pH adaptation potassium efflux system protein C, sodium/hydrogen antiporter subunit n=1 Tax=Natronococcus amylolyticus DSM 10524 TaxID=1227497 RepID=L9WYX1_9EURY|nr:cation:proton antiporter subunit C [Natronococcus amylolyticus]ELY54679.1 pH adaptation potassium efflux system protein C, sodium/hydrogen antiporter subunit [Natronococcus amylolyticus DSM 10524]